VADNLARKRGSTCSTPPCATASRRRASIFRSRTRSPSRRMLDEFGIDYVEGGYPGANPTDTAFFEPRSAPRRVVRRLRHDQAGRRFHLQRSRPGRLIQARKRCGLPCRQELGLPRAVALGCTNEENLESISESVKAVTEAGKEAMVDCEHFFDGYKANPDYALACAKAATRQARAGSCCATPMAAPSLRRSRDHRHLMPPASPATRLGIHAHNDTGRRWPIRWPPSTPACGRSRARSTASASVAAMPTWSR
jgi:2-isopropylmalate synthase